MIISILPGNGKEPPEPGDEIRSLNRIRTDDFKTLSKTNENAAHLTENLLTITEELMMEGNRRAIIK
jgi:phospholipid/cholesterol/gamma-HCH transport system substrate-binding protein